VAARGGAGGARRAGRPRRRRSYSKTIRVPVFGLIA
jgi:hypothetical protein